MQSTTRASFNKSITTLRHDNLDSTEESTIIYGKETISAILL